MQLYNDFIQKDHPLVQKNKVPSAAFKKRQKKKEDDRKKEIHPGDL